MIEEEEEGNCHITIMMLIAISTAVMRLLLQATVEFQGDQMYLTANIKPFNVSNSSAVKQMEHFIYTVNACYRFFFLSLLRPSDPLGRIVTYCLISHLTAV